MAPTVFGDVDHDSDLARNEVFGPVQAVLRFSSEDEVLAQANDSPFGLGAYLHTADARRIQRFVRELECGTVIVNGRGAVSPTTPFGGYKQSGFGREGGRAGIEEMVQTKDRAGRTLGVSNRVGPQSPDPSRDTVGPRAQALGSAGKSPPIPPSPDRSRSRPDRGNIRALTWPDIPRVKDGVCPVENIAEPMETTRPTQRGGDTRSAENDSRSDADLDEPQRDSRAPSRRHPGVRLLLTLVVLLPMLATGILILSSANSAWRFRQNAEIVAKDATALQVVASARAQMNSLEVPLSAVSYAAQIGISEPVLDTLLHPAVPFSTQLAQGTATIAGLPDVLLDADPARRRRAAAGHDPEGRRQVGLVRRRPRLSRPRWPTDIDTIWYKDYNRLQSDIASWQPPGSFEVHASALRQTYQAFLAGGHEIEGAIFVLEGIGPADSKQELIQAAGRVPDRHQRVRRRS